MTDAEKRAQARRARMTLRKGRLDEPEGDVDPVFGAEAVSLVHRLTLMSYSLAGKSIPAVSRAELSCRFVRRGQT